MHKLTRLIACIGIANVFHSSLKVTLERGHRPLGLGYLPRYIRCHIPNILRRLSKRNQSILDIRNAQFAFDSAKPSGAV